MADEKWQRAQQLFLQVADRPPKERAALLEEACGDDAELRAEVEALLEHDSQATDDFLRPPEPPPSIRQPDSTDGPDPLIGRRIDGYEIRTVIASGGMGTVYEAEQDQPRRIVALKVMRHLAASRSALRRFQFESQVLGRLRHPNIAHVYQAGMHTDREGILGPVDGRVPFFAMEYIPDAKPITRYAEENSLDTRDRLQLFAKVCDAVHHGHQKGIIHRDLKPGNVLVDSTGEPKVIDFGVARATDSDVAITTAQTDVGQLIGTMQYMSPEQCDADPHEIDTRSDVYSLGVVLYELLTGELPYEATGSTIVQAAQIIKEHVPTALSAHNPKLRGDIETVTLKALEKNREKRYQSAADLAQDIRRHLSGEPIEARPPTPWTRTVHWVARHPVLKTASACLGIGAMVIVATYVSAWFVNSHPYELKLLKRPGREDVHQGYEARLLSLSNRTLHTWRSNNEAGISLAKLVQRPAELGGGLLAVLGFQSIHSGPLRAAICAFDAEGDLENPLWERRVKTDEILPDLREKRGFVAEQFGVPYAWLLDVFPNRVGSEIVAVFNAGSCSQRILRIYDLKGELLYQVWHDGTVNGCYWMLDAGLLIFAGDCHRPFHDPYGKLLGETVQVPVVFALRPTVGSIGTDWLPLETGKDPLSPAWYVRLWPDNVADIVQGICLAPPNPPHHPGRHVLCSVILKLNGKPDTSTWWVINEFGEEVEGTRGVGDDYKSNQNLPDDDANKLPDPNSFYLAPMPSIVQASSGEGESDGPEHGNEAP